ncbi:hypothetical protein CRM22_000694 [Opisthorchis felineus]|uniref:Vesicle transport protein n=1 Tax=Opisthorchis felineus TaxID=147828 RepID=A0A4S2MDW2_OPIFE|nr:hypothetical protein CRM22_000694 [Opisthorchis felineus]
MQFCRSSHCSSIFFSVGYIFPFSKIFREVSMLNHLLTTSSSKNGGPHQSNGNHELDILPGPLRNFLGPRSDKSTTAPGASTTTATLEVESQGILSSWFTQSDTDPLMPKAFSRRQRLLGFVLCLLAASFCLCLAMAFLPLIGTPFGIRKYVLLHTLGSILLIGSFSFLWGPWNHLKSMFSRERLAFTLSFLFSLFAGLYAVLVWHSALCAGLALLVQISLICWQIVDSIPGGQAGLRAIARGGYWTVKGVARGLPV